MKLVSYFNDTTVDYSLTNLLDIANYVQMHHTKENILITMNDNTKYLVIETLDDNTKGKFECRMYWIDRVTHEKIIN